jgi:formylglycine-generating enzyme required for sulfatase activity
MGTPEAALSDLARLYGGTRESYREESPQHTVTLPAFALARVPVTNALYAHYVAATGAAAPLIWRGAQPDAHMAAHPVVDINWEEAQQFCQWLCSAAPAPLTVAGDPARQIEHPRFRLPSEAEWEHAARGTDGRRFPWGDEFDATCANTREAAQANTMPVGSFPEGASPYGLLDMAGNVWELTSSLDRLYPYAADAERERLDATERRIARGGCYANPQGFARCACRFRFGPTVRTPFLGFRLALSLDD